MTTESTEQTPAPEQTQQPEQAVGPRRNPFRELWNFQELFDRFDSDFFMRPLGISRGEWFPRLDVRRENGDVVVEAELPGIRKEDVKIEVSDDGLVISGEKRQETETRQDNYYRSERSFGRFTRRISLPHGADAEQADARFEDGVLRIRIPVHQAPAGTTIEVQG